MESVGRGGVLGAEGGDMDVLHSSSPKQWDGVNELTMGAQDGQRAARLSQWQPKETIAAAVCSPVAAAEASTSTMEPSSRFARALSATRTTAALPSHVGEASNSCDAGEAG